MSPYVRIERGSLYLDAEVYSRYFRGFDAAVLTGDSRSLLLLPIHHAAAGGLLIKMLNSRGDRVVHASEALVARGVPADLKGLYPACWDASAAALKIDLTAAEESLSRNF